MSMGDTLTWEGSVPEIRLTRKRAKTKHTLHYKVRFIQGFHRSRVENMTLSVESPWTDVDVAKLMVKKWRRLNRPYAMRRVDASLCFDIPNSVVAVHAFKSPKHPNGRIVPRAPNKLDVFSTLDVTSTGS